MTDTIFDGFSCGNFGLESSVLLADYAVNCEDGYYTIFVYVCGLLVLLWPIGIIYAEQGLQVDHGGRC